MNSRRMTGITLIGEIVTTNARGSISPTTTFTTSSPQIRAGEATWCRPEEPQLECPLSPYIRTGCNMRL